MTSLFYYASFSFEGELCALDFTMLQGSFGKYKVQYINGFTHIELWSDTLSTIQLVFEASSWRRKFDLLTWEQFSNTYVGRA